MVFRLTKPVVRPAKTSQDVMALDIQMRIEKPKKGADITNNAWKIRATWRLVPYTVDPVTDDVIYDDSSAIHVLEKDLLSHAASIPMVSNAMDKVQRAIELVTKAKGKG